jgi:hypothetical protein
MVEVQTWTPLENTTMWPHFWPPHSVLSPTSIVTKYNVLILNLWSRSMNYKCIGLKSNYYKLVCFSPSLLPKWVPHKPNPHLSLVISVLSSIVREEFNYATTSTWPLIYYIWTLEFELYRLCLPSIQNKLHLAQLK